jgi:hypothetical protein
MAGNSSHKMKRNQIADTSDDRIKQLLKENSKLKTDLETSAYLVEFKMWKYSD